MSESCGIEQVYTCTKKMYLEVILKNRESVIETVDIE